MSSLCTELPNKVGGQNSVKSASKPEALPARCCLAPFYFIGIIPQGASRAPNFVAASSSERIQGTELVRALRQWSRQGVVMLAWTMVTATGVTRSRRGRERKVRFNVGLGEDRSQCNTKISGLWNVQNGTII